MAPKDMKGQEMPLFVLFVAVPIIEITLFVQIGGLIGLWWTLGIVITTAFLGSLLIRAQGAMAMERLRMALSAGQNPTGPIADGAAILAGGLLLLTPGFFTDTVGFLLLFPPTRKVLFRLIAARIKVQGFAASTMRQDIIEGEFTEIDPESPPHAPQDRYGD